MNKLEWLREFISSDLIFDEDAQKEIEDTDR